MNATELRPVFNLTTADVLQISNDIRFFRVALIEKGESAAGRYKVHLRSLDGISTALLVRGGREMVLVVPRIPAIGLLPVEDRPANSS